MKKEKTLIKYVSNIFHDFLMQTGREKSLKRIFYEFFNFLFPYIFITPFLLHRSSHDSVINGFTLTLQHNITEQNNSSTHSSTTIPQCRRE